jgi:hypothetical protein
MAFIVECYRIRPKSGTFCLNGSMWERALLEGLLNGWLPEGAGKAPGVDGNAWSTSTLPCGYRCEEFSLGKIMTDSDALGLADGLQAYLDRQFHCYGGREKALKELKPAKIGPTLIKEGMDVNLLIDANRSWSIEFVESFSGFLRGGGFVFHWDD